MRMKNCVIWDQITRFSSRLTTTDIIISKVSLTGSFSRWPNILVTRISHIIKKAASLPLKGAAFLHIIVKMPWNFYPTDASSNVTMVGAINQFSFTFPDYPPLTQPESIDENQFCDENHRPARCSDSQICYCTHRVKVKKDSIVELIIVNEKDGKEITTHKSFYIFVFVCILYLTLQNLTRFIIHSICTAINLWWSDLNTTSMKSQWLLNGLKNWIVNSYCIETTIIIDLPLKIRYQFQAVDMPSYF